MDNKADLAASGDIARALTSYRDILDGCWARHCGDVQALNPEGETETAIYRSASALADKLGLGDVFAFGGAWARGVALSQEDTLPTDLIEECFRSRHSANRAIADALLLGPAILAVSERMNAISGTASAQAGKQQDSHELEAEWGTFSGYFRVLEPEFWESVANAIMRLCAAYDRTAQLLSYVFFNVRVFDRDTFMPVTERLKKNYVKEDPLFRAQDAWRIIDGTKSGIEVLQSRRNALTHSTTFRASGVWYPEVALAKRARTTLERGRAEALRQQSPESEMHYLKVEAGRLLDVQQAALSLCHFGLETFKLAPVRFPPRVK